MTSRNLLLALTLTFDLVGAMHAAAAAPAPATPVSGVVVTAPVDPKVVASYPIDGASVPFGTVLIKLVFNQPMTPEAWSYGRSDAGAFPDCLARPRLLADQRTVALLCSLPAGRTYAIEVNAAPGFTSRAGRSVKPFLLRFTTTTDATVSVHDALALAGLTDADAPIMDWNGAEGVSDATPKPRDASAP